MAPERHDDRFLVGREDRRPGLSRLGRLVRDSRPLSPFRHRLGVDPIALRQAPQALLTMLYRSTDGLRRGDAPV